MQRTADRQKTLAAHGALISDERLPIEVLDLAQATSVEGRVLVHGQDEQTGRNYLMLEGTDARVHFIQYTPEMEEARSRGEIRTNSFVRLQRRLDNSIQIEDFGDAERLLRDSDQLNAVAGRLLKRGIIPAEDGWGGWLGRFQSALRETALQLSAMTNRELTRVRGRRRDQSRGR